MAITREDMSNSKFKQLLAPIALTADKGDIPALDITGFESASFIANVGAADANHVPDDNNHLQVKLEHSDDNVNFAACRDDEVIGSMPGMLATGTFAKIKEDPNNDSVFAAGYKGNRRYVRPVVKATGNLGNGVILGIAAIMRGSKYRPVDL